MTEDLAFDKDGRFMIPTDQDLETSGFTSLAITQYKGAVTDFSVKLKDKSIAYSDEDEVSKEHVRTATAHLTSRPHKRDKICTFMNVGEIFFTFLGGAGASNLNEKWGVILFLVSVIAAISLFFSRRDREVSL